MGQQPSAVSAQGSRAMGKGPPRSTIAQLVAGNQATTDAKAKK
ncbi:hypothetical protein HaLaN_26115, partial [Haematococcus lacustris]